MYSTAGTMSTPPSTHPPPSAPISLLPKRPKTEPSPAMASATPNGASQPAPPPPLSTSPPLLVKKLLSHAKTPTRGSAFAAGYDIYSAETSTVPKRGKELVGTGISIAVGNGCCEPIIRQVWTLRCSFG